MEKPNIPKAKPSQEDRDKIQEQLLEELAYLQPVQHGIFIITVHVTALQKIFCQTPAKNLLPNACFSSTAKASVHDSKITKAF